MAIGVINPSVAARAWAAMGSRLTFITGHENSNGAYGGYGYAYGWNTSLADAGVKQYSPGLTAASTISSTTGADDKGASRLASTATPFLTSVPSSTGTGGWDDTTNIVAAGTYNDVDALFAFGKAHNAGGGGLYSTFYAPRVWLGINAMTIFSASGGAELNTSPTKAAHFDRNAALTFDFWYTPSLDTGGTFRPRAVQGSVPNSYVNWTSGDATVTVNADGQYTYLARATRTMAAATRDQKFRGQWAGQFAPYLPSSEVGLAYIYLWESNARAGFAYVPFWAVGGCSTEDMAYSIARGTSDNGATTDCLQGFLSVLSRPAVAASQEPFCIWVIGDTSNSSSETDTSVLTGKAATSAAAYVENVSYVIDWISQAWRDLGYKPANLLFMLRGDHPAKNATSEGIQVNLRTTAFSALAAKYSSRVFGFVSHHITSSAQLTAQNLYAGAEVDGYHLNNATGYATYTSRLISAWRSASGPRGTHARGRMLSAAVR